MVGLFGMMNWKGYAVKCSWSM